MKLKQNFLNQNYIHISRNDEMFTANVLLKVIEKQRTGLAQLSINGKTYINSSYRDVTKLQSDILLALTDSFYEYTLINDRHEAGESIEKLNIVEEKISNNLINDTMDVDLFTQCIKGVLESELPMEILIKEY